MKPTWLIQTNIDGVNIDSMIDAVWAQGMSVHEKEHRIGERINFSSYGPKDCVICYGDIDFVRQIHRRAPFVPGAWANFDHMKCSFYYAYFGEYLLNRQYLMMPVGELLRQWKKLALTTPVFNDKQLAFMKPTFVSEPCQSVFVRPDSGAKPFTGYVIKSDEQHKIKTLVQAVGSEMLVVVAPEKSITAEWRFVVCDGKVIAGCQYLPIENPNFTPSSLRLAEIIASQEWQPDRCYTVDIAESEGDVHLLEINSFSCAGFYGCEIGPIVQCASATAIKEWEEYCDPNA